MRSTRRSRSERVFFLALAYALTGCTLVGGEPWGEVVLSGAVRFDGTGRWGDVEGEYRTSKDYTIFLTKLLLHVDGVDAELTQGGASEVDFDPASPPEGYSLCHNGHCHADNGRLVDYEEIALESSSGSTRVRVTRSASETINLFSEGSQALELGPCTARCELSRGTLSSAGILLGEIEVDGLVVDRRPPETARLHENGASVRFVSWIGERIAGAVDEPIDDTSAPTQEVFVRLDAPRTLFDGIDFGALLGGEPLSGVQDLGGFPSVTESVRNAFVEDSEVFVDVDSVASDPPELPHERDLVWWNDRDRT